MNWFVWIFVGMVMLAVLIVVFHNKPYRGKHRGERHPVEARDIAVLLGRREKDW